MDNSNIIISIIIVLCIAAGVTAYSLTNTDNVFTDLQGITPASGDDGGLGDDGVGNNTNGDAGNNIATNPNTESNSGSGSGSSSGSGSGSGGGKNPTPVSKISQSKAISIAKSYVPSGFTCIGCEDTGSKYLVYFQNSDEGSGVGILISHSGKYLGQKGQQ